MSKINQNLLIYHAYTKSVLQFTSEDKCHLKTGQRIQIFYNTENRLIFIIQTRD